MEPIDLYADDLHNRLLDLRHALPGVEIRTVDGRRLRGPVVAVDSDTGRAVAFTVMSRDGRVRLTAAHCLSLAVIDPHG